MSVETYSIQTSKVKETIALLAIYTNLDIKKKKKPYENCKNTY